MMDLKLDTLDKKPKITSIAVLSAVMLAALVLLIALGGEKLIRFSCLLVAAYFLSVSVMLLRAFFLQIRYNLYSYNTIFYIGFALFAFFCSITSILLFLNLREVPPEHVLTNLISLVTNSAKTYALLTFPFLFIFSAALVISNLSLIRHEGFRPVNLLGIVLAVLLLGGESLIFGLDYYATGSQTEVMLHDMFTNFLASIYLYFECMMLGTMVADAVAARYEPKKDKDYIIVLGCAIRKDGTPTPLLRGRLDRAMTFAQAQEAETGKAPIFVLSGGKGADECVSEAECMRRYLAEQGVPESRMLLEDKSTDTAENMSFSKKLVLELVRPGKEAPRAYWPSLDDPETRIAFSTTNYHVFRSGIKARQAKLRALGMGCRSKWYFWPNAAVREFVGLLTQHLGKQAVILLSLTLFYTILTIACYELPF